MKIDRPTDASPPPPPGAVDALSARTNRSNAATGSPGAPPGQNAASGTPATAADTESVRLSGASRSIGALRAGDADIRTDKVVALRTRIEAGEFHVDVKKVAERMINEAAELLETISSVPK